MVNNGRSARFWRQAAGVSVIIAAIALVASAGSLLYLRSQAATVTYKVMPLGDSITEGMHNTVYSPDGGYRKVLSDRLGTKIDMVGSLSNNNVGVTDKEHEGHSGWRTDQINGSISGWIGTYKPDIVLLHIGTNDVLQGKSANEMINNVDQIMAKIYAANPSTRIVLASMIPMWGQGSWAPPARTTFNAAVPGLVNKYTSQGKAAYFADMSTGGFVTGGTDFPDGVHPNLQGYTKMANVWEPIIKTIMGTTTNPSPSPSPNPTPAPTPVPSGQGSVNNTAFTYSSGWQSASNSESYQSDDQYSSTAGATYSLSFSGTQAKIYTTKASHHGIFAVKIDNGSETTVDLYSATRAGQQLVYTSPTLASGTHTITVRVTGTKNAASSGTVVVADRIDITGGTANPSPAPTPAPTPTPQPGTCSLLGDVNCDNRVNALDLSILVSKDGQNYPAADFNKDGTVGSADLAIVISKWTW